MLSILKATLFGLTSLSIAPISATYPVPTSNEKIIYAEKTFTTYDGLTIHGHLALPRQANTRVPVVLLLVGSGAGNRYEDVPGEITSTGQPALLFKLIEESIIDSGVAVFTYDKRGVIPTDNTFQDSRVTEDFRTSTAKNLAADAISAFDLVSSFPEIDPTKISILGHSEGTVLGLKVAEVRPSVRSLILLGLFTRSLRDVLHYQTVTANMRIMSLVDENADGYLDSREVEIFHKEAPSNIPEWPDLLKIMDYTKDSKISNSEQRFYFERASRSFFKSITDEKVPWKRKTPRDWFQQYFAEGAFLQRFTAFCNKINIVHGEADNQTPFEDALVLQTECVSSGVSLQSFSSFPDLGHGFSPRTGLKGWKNTIGPIEPPVLNRIAEIVRASVR